MGRGSSSCSATTTCTCSAWPLVSSALREGDTLGDVLAAPASDATSSSAGCAAGRCSTAPRSPAGPTSWCTRAAAAVDAADGRQLAREVEASWRGDDWPSAPRRAAPHKRERLERAAPGAARRGRGGQRPARACATCTPTAGPARLLRTARRGAPGLPAVVRRAVAPQPRPPRGPADTGPTLRACGCADDPAGPPPTNGLRVGPVAHRRAPRGPAPSFSEPERPRGPHDHPCGFAAGLGTPLLEVRA
jgi:hypothetical protein